MKNEMNSMTRIRDRNFVKLPNEANTISCKWVFKTNRNLVGNIERYKARLVAKRSIEKKELIIKRHALPILRKILPSL